MYCRKCGKPTNDNAPLCADCSTITASVKQCKTLSILGLVFSVLGFAFYLFASFYTLLLLIMAPTRTHIIVCWILSVLFTLAGFVLDIISIVKYAKFKQTNSNPSKGILVISIIGIVISSITLYIYMLCILVTIF